VPSVDYYARLERGNLTGVSDEVLGSIAHALRLDEAETAHLFALARAAQSGPARRKRAAKEQELRPGLQRFMDAITGAPTWVRNERMDFIAANPLGRADLKLSVEVLDRIGGLVAPGVTLNPDDNSYGANELTVAARRR
jgi:hypothetical protein